MKILRAVVLLSVPLLFVGADEAEKRNAKCPISGNPAKADHVLNVNGKEVAFCCDKCPKAYAKKLNIKGGVAALTADPGKCPLTGKPARKNQQVIRKTATFISFCCGKCLGKCIEKNELSVKDEGPKKCPISNNPAKSEHSLLVNGESVYFCCDKCPKAYAKKIGINVAALEKDPGACPLTGRPAKKDKSLILVKSEVVSFCCGNCKKKYVTANFKDGRVIPKSDKKSDKADKKKAEEKEKIRL